MIIEFQQNIQTTNPIMTIRKIGKCTTAKIMYHKLTTKNIGLTKLLTLSIMIQKLRLRPLSVCVLIIFLELHHTFTHKSKPDGFEINRQHTLKCLRPIRT